MIVTNGNIFFGHQVPDQLFRPFLLHILCTFYSNLSDESHIYDLEYMAYIFCDYIVCTYILRSGFHQAYGH